MAKITVVMLCLAGCLFVCVNGDCGVTTHTGWSDKWLYSVFRTIFEFDERCTWTLKPPSNATDIMLVMKISRIDNFNEDDVIRMPDGEQLTAGDIAANSLTPWSATYRHKDASSRSCHRNNNNLPTPNDVKISRTWPPKIHTKSSDIDLVISYSFTYCDEYRAVTVRSAWPSESF